MAIARLDDGRTIKYVDEIVGSGASKDVYRSCDGTQVVALYRRPDAKARGPYQARLKAILSRFNPTLPRSSGGAAASEEEARRFRDVFSWPVGIVESPRLGLVLPAYPERFWFETNPEIARRADTPWNRVPKTAKWFTSLRRVLRPSERGDFLALVEVSLLLARAVARMHQAGLGHSDLSAKNVLVDPLRDRYGHATPGCLVTDIDTLVVPGHYPADVLGTHPYIAPEVLATSKLKLTDARRVLPSRQADRHALSVLIYELLLARHPLDGPRILPVETQEEEDFLAFGAEALFIEDPQDSSNRPKDVFPNFERLGGPIAALIRRAFVSGLHEPNRRPLAAQWVQALHETVDLLHPCRNRTCPWKWYPQAEDGSLRCPRCGSAPRTSVPILLFVVKRRQGGVSPIGKLVCFDGRPLYQWHFSANPDAMKQESPDIQALIAHDADSDRWFLVNRGDKPIRVDGSGVVIRRGARLALTPGSSVILDPIHGLTAEIHMHDQLRSNASEQLEHGA